MAKILVLDDELGFRNVISKALEPLNQILFIAEDGIQAVSIAENEHPDVAIIDIMVPDMDGLQVTEKLKKINPDIKCIIVSGFVDSEFSSKSSKLNIYSYMSKPLDIDKLINTVKQALGLK